MKYRTESALQRAIMDALVRAKGDGPHAKQCEICGATFLVKKSRLAKARFCSKPCAGVWHATTRLAALHKERGHGPTHRDCSFCGKRMTKWGSASRAAAHRYCSRECSNKGRGLRFSGPNNHAWKGGHRAAHERRCLVCASKLVERARRYCSTECRLKAGVMSACSDCGKARKRVKSEPNARCNACASRLRAGAGNANWKGGITPANQRIRASAEYAAWRKAVFERDGYRCVACGQLGGELHADHIKPFALYPSLRLELTNGRTLCRACHELTPSFLGGAMRMKRELANP